MHVTWFAASRGGCRRARVGHVRARLGIGSMPVLGGADARPRAECSTRPWSRGRAGDARGRARGVTSESCTDAAPGKGRSPPSGAAATAPAHNSQYGIAAHRCSKARRAPPSRRRALAGLSACQLDTRMFIHGAVRPASVLERDGGARHRRDVARPQVSGTRPAAVGAAAVPRRHRRRLRMMVVVGGPWTSSRSTIVALDLDDMWARRLPSRGRGWSRASASPPSRSARASSSSAARAARRRPGPPSSPTAAPSSTSVSQAAMNDLYVLASRTARSPTPSAGDRRPPCYRHHGGERCAATPSSSAASTAPQTIGRLPRGGLAPWSPRASSSDADPLAAMAAAAAAARAERARSVIRRASASSAARVAASVASGDRGIRARARGQRARERRHRSAPYAHLLAPGGRRRESAPADRRRPQGVRRRRRRPRAAAASGGDAGDQAQAGSSRCADGGGIRGRRRREPAPPPTAAAHRRGGASTRSPPVARRR